MNLCRACLSFDTDLFPSNDNFICNYNLLTNLNVQAFDGKSQHFCQSCIDAVNFFIDFRNKCALAESNLQESCTVLTIKSEKQEDDTEFVLKREIKCEEFDSIESNTHTTHFEDDNQESNDDTFYIKTEEADGIKLKSARRKLKREKSCKKKKVMPLKDVPALDTEEKYKKLTTDKPACGLCGKIFDDASSLNQHVEGHKTDKTCKLCPHLIFEKWPQLLAHRLLHTSKSQSCHMCSKRCYSHINLEYHYRKVHCEENNIRMPCDQCPKTFSTARRLSKHIWANHSKNTFICDICSKVYKNKQILKSHLIGHGDIKRFVCNSCGFSCKYASGLAAHKLRRHTPKTEKRTCKQCERVFDDPEKFEKHICTDKSRICPICGKHLLRGFSRHMEVHREEKRHKCPRCPSEYRSRAALKVHEDRHDNNPRQQCEHCLRRFYSRSVLIKHRRVHTGEKPYACKKCDMRFTANHNLKVHMKVHGEMLIVKKESATD